MPFNLGLRNGFSASCYYSSRKAGFFFSVGMIGIVVILLHTIKAQWEYVLGSYVGCSIDSKDVMCSVL